jgi:pimeloyl-ACP methyl ester carboxylesterase
MKPWKCHSKSRTSRSLVVSLVTAALVATAGPGAGRTPEPARRQLGWVLRQLNGAAADLTVAEIKRHVAPVALERLPARAYMALLKEGAAQAGGARISRVAGMHSPWALVAVIETGNLGPAAIYINTQRRDAGLITALSISDVPAPSAEEIATPGPYTGPFHVSPRRHLYVTCMGEGSPTVILEAGGGGGAAAWREVQPGIAEVTRVCSYDRANVPGGASSFARKPRTARGVVRDLHALILESGLPGPYVLVGHSNGGLFARMYASLHADDVAGLVLVDSVHENGDIRRDEILQEYLSDEEWEAIVAERERQAALPFVSTIGDEQIDIALSFDQMRAIRAEMPLPQLALFVMSHGVGTPPNPGEPEGLSEALEEMWQELQDDLASLSKDSTRTVVEDIGHDIPSERPDAVVSAVRQVIDSLRASGEGSRH